MEILVTGASGFVGRHLCFELESRSHSLTKITSNNCDLTKSDSLNSFNAMKFGLIFHLAAYTRAGDFCANFGGDQWIVNQLINTNVLTWWKNYQPEAKLVAIGTSVSYANAKDKKLVEENYVDGVPLDRFYSYAMSKRMLLVGMESLHRQYGLNYLYLVPSTLYGPRYHTDGREMHFVYDMIRKILRGKKYMEPVVLWGDGYQKRELVYIEDFMRLMLRLVEGQSNDTVNIGAGQEHTIREFAQLICDITCYDFREITFDEKRYVGLKSKCLDITKLNGILANLELTELKVGLKKTIQWFVAEEEKLLRR